MLYDADGVPWCGLFLITCMVEVGIAPASTTVTAKSWATWGQDIAADRLAPEAVLVFKHEGGKYVGLYVGENDTAWRRDYNEVRPHSAIANKPPISLVNRSAAHGQPLPLIAG